MFFLLAVSINKNIPSIPSITKFMLKYYQVLPTIAENYNNGRVLVTCSSIFINFPFSEPPFNVTLKKDMPE